MLFYFDATSNRIRNQNAPKAPAVRINFHLSEVILSNFLLTATCDIDRCDLLRLRSVGENLIRRLRKTKLNYDRQGFRVPQHL